MKKLKIFLKNYKKVLIGTLIALIVMMSVTTAALLVGKIRNIKESNDAQMQEIINNSNWLSDYYDEISNAQNNLSGARLEKLAGILSLEPGDVTDAELMDSYCKKMQITNVAAADAQGNIVYSYEFGLNTLSDAKSLPLFDIDEGGKATVTTEDGMNYFSRRCGQYYLVGCTGTAADSAAALDEQKYWDTSFKNLWVSSKSRVAVADSETGVIIYCDDERFEGYTVDTSQYSSSLISDIAGTAVCGDIYSFADGTRAFITIIPFWEVLGGCIRDALTEEILFIIATVILIFFIIFLRDDELDPSQEVSLLGKYFLKTQLRRFTCLATAVGVFIVFAAVMIINLNNLISLRSELDERNNDILDSVDMYYYDVKSLKEANNQEMYESAALVSAFLGEHEDYISKDGLTKIARAMNLDGITMFGQDGKTIATSTSFDHLDIYADEGSSLYELRYVLMGKDSLCVSGDSNIMPEGDLLYAKPHRGSDGVTCGAIAVTASSLDRLWEDTYTDSIENLKQYLFSGRTTSGINVIITDENGEILLSSDDAKTGASVEKLGLSLENLTDGFFDWFKMEGTDSAVSVTKILSRGTFLIITSAFRWVTTSSIVRSIIALILYILLVLWMIYDGLGSKYHFEKRRRKIKDADDWQNPEIGWEYLAASQKINKVFRVLIYLFGIYLILLKLSYPNGSIGETWLTYIISGEWQKTISVFSITGNFCLVCVTVSVVGWVKSLLMVISESTGQSSETACRLIASIVKYVGAILCFFLCATNFGVDTGAIVASIGIVGFGLTFGAQDIIKDVIAGIFILFEGDYKVGDMLLIGGEWYWVRSIGVRTTKVEAWGKFKLINNSQMAGVVNIQNSSACVDCDIMIGNEYALEDIEELMYRELPPLKEQLEANVSTPAYKGIQSYTGNGTVIRIRSYCPQLSQGWVGRFLRREVRLILERNNIRVPMTAYEIHNHEMSKEEIARDIQNC